MAYVGNDRALTQVRGRSQGAGLQASSLLPAPYAHSWRSSLLFCSLRLCPQDHQKPPPARCVAALLQVEAFDTSLDLYGQFAFLLWRSVYITKQVWARRRQQALARPSWPTGRTLQQHVHV